VGAPRRGHQRAHGSGQAGTSVQQKHYRESPIAGAVGGTIPELPNTIPATPEPCFDKGLNETHVSNVFPIISRALFKRVCAVPHGTYNTTLHRPAPQHLERGAKEESLTQRIRVMFACDAPGFDWEASL
jgi:hypothetical protein